MKCLLLCSLLVLIIHRIDCKETTLKALAIVHRHGDRNIIDPSYPNDPYKDISNWPDGFSQLTIPGKQRLFALGQFVRERYSDYLTDNPLEVRSRSSGANRCVQSAAMLLAGAYPPKGRWDWNTSMPWQPFPIMTRPREEDPLLNPSAICPEMERERKRVERSQEYQDVVKSNEDLFRDLSKFSGANVTNIQDAEYLYDDLLIEKLSNFSRPSWVSDEVLNKLRTLSGLSFYFEFSTPKLQRLRSGIFFKDLLGYFTSSPPEETNGDIPPPEDDGFPNKKFYHYSSHDTLIAGLLSSMNSFDKQPPPYAATLFFELHRIDQQDTINIFYLADTYSKQLRPITPPGCDTPPKLCSLTNFAAAIKHLIPDDWSKECEVADVLDDNLPAIIAASIAVSFGLIVIFLFGFSKFKRRSSANGNLLDETTRIEGTLSS